jgi:hypothetical protein
MDELTARENGVGLQFLRCRKIYLFQQVCKALNWKLFETAMTGR